MFEELLAADSRFCVAEGTEPRFGLVCFRLTGASRQQSEAVLEAVNSGGEPGRALYQRCCALDA